MDKQKGPKGFLVMLPSEIIEIPQDSDKSWLTLFYSLPRELAEQNWQPMIDAIWENRTVEDYETAGSTVKTDFMRKWHHNRSGKPISLDEMMENKGGDIFEVADPRGEFEQKVMTAQLPAPSGGKKLPFAAQAEGSFPCPFPCFLRCNSRICAV